MRRLAPLVCLLSLLLGAPAHLRAQGSSTDIITGTVTGPNGGPVPGAQVAAVSAETGVRRTATTNAQGRYTIAFPGGGGQYQLTVTVTGLSPSTRLVARQGDEDVLIAHVQMETQVVTLEGISVRGQRQQVQLGPRGADPGGQERALSGEAIQRLPVDPSDLSQIATLTPGVVSVRGDSASGFSILGQGPGSNQITLDGASFGGAQGFGGGTGSGVPAEAVRVTRVITNSYDVSRGQFSGGQIATTTRSGTNVVQGSLSYSLRDPSLQWAGQNSAFSGRFSLNRLSGGVGGPIIRDKLFYFGSLSFQRRAEEVASLLSADPLSLQRLGVAPDSVTRLLSLAASSGLFDPAAGLPDARTGNQLSSIARLDYNLNDHHTLTLRGDVNRFSQDAMRVGPLDIPQSGGTSTNTGEGLLLTLTSRFGNGWINELRAYGARQQSETEPYSVLPSGRVRVSSLLEDGSTGISTLGFGGGSVSQRSRTRNAELSNELSLLLGTTHRIRLGGSVTYTDSRSTAGANRYGTFTFNSLEDLAEDRPAAFSRTLSARERESGGVNSALYVGDSWRPAQRLQLTFGGRLERSHVGSRPEHNPAVEELFGRRTDLIPTEIAFTPRLGFSYNLPGAPGQAQGAGGGSRGQGGGGRGQGGDFRGGPGGFGGAGVIRGGIGVFRSSPSWSLFSAARDLTGLPDSQVQVSCVGAGVPTPDWAVYGADAASIPTSCVGGGTGAGRNSGRGTSVAVFDPGYRTPQSWRASLGGQRRLVGLLSLSLDATYAEGRYQQGVRDLNLRTTPRLTLPQEGNRPVFVPASAIVPRTGQVGYFASRIHPRFGQVMEIHSGLRSRSWQATVGLNGAIPQWRTVFQANYSHLRSRDQGSAGGGFGRGGFGGGFRGGFGGGVGSLPLTAGNPNQPEWGRSDFERRHSISTTVSRPMSRWLDLSVVGRASSGGPFTPIVGGDINGDGARNDRAFIFDPAATAAPEVAAAMSRLLATAPAPARSCLEAQLGRIAERNSCQNPWSYSLDLRFNLRPALPGVGRRLTLSVDAVNTLSGLDRALHGESGLRGWGQFRRADAVLLYPRGFDAAAQSFRYEVNERFGSARSTAATYRDPFQLQIQGRIAVGRSNNQGGGFGGPGILMRAPGGGGGGARGPGGAGTIMGGPGGFDPAVLIARAVPNPIERLVGMADTLQLTPAQREQINELSLSVEARQDSLAQLAQREIGGAGGQRDVGEMLRTVQPRMEQAQRNVEQALREAQRILTPEQWARVPEEVRNPPRGFGAGVRRNP